VKRKTVNFALQGGGSHGAFTWGVLDRLLEDGRIDIDGISGASAGAMNAIALAHGYTVGGRDGARQALQDFWGSVATKSPFSLMPDDAAFPLDIGTQSNPPPIFKALLSMTRFFSPDQPDRRCVAAASALRRRPVMAMGRSTVRDAASAGGKFR